MGEPGEPAEASAGRPRDVLRWLLAEARASGAARGYLIGTVAAGLAVTGLIIAQAALLARALSGAAPGAVLSLRGALAALLLVVLARAAAVHLGEVAALRAAALVKLRLRCRVLASVLKPGPPAARPYPAGGTGGTGGTGEAAVLATTGLDALDPYFARYLPQSVLAVAVPAAVLVAVTTADWVSGLIIVVTLPLIPAFAVLVGWQTKARTQRSFRLLARLGGHFLDAVQGLPTLKLFRRATAEEQVIAAVTSEYRVSVMSTLRVAFLSALVLELSAALATALVAVEVGIRLLYGHLGYDTALFVLLLTPEAYLPLRNASAAYHASADGTAAASRAFELTGAPGRGAPPQRSPRVNPPDLRSSQIMWNAVQVDYPGRAEPVIDRLDLTISPGDLVSITGGNGAGKTTLLSLLLRFIDPVSGSTQVGGADLASLDLDLWRRQIAWLPQHPSLFGWSVADNIALGAPAATRDDVERAAARAGAAGFIGELPAGYDTVLDERGLRLSAGQRQKIALARLFLRDAPLVLLDEPTGHLDAASAAEIGAAIRTLLAGRTVLLVTHGGATWPASTASRRLHVADGQVIELAAPAVPAVAAGAG